MQRQTPTGGRIDICGARVKSCGACKHRYKKGSTEETCPTCGADRKCRNPKVRGRSKCRMHRGGAVRGIAHPRYKHGRYASGWPARLLKDYQAARADPDRLNLEAEIGLVDAQLQTLGRKLSRDGKDPGDAGILKEVRALVEQRRRLVDTETKRRIAAETVITKGDVHLLIGPIAQVLKNRVTDRETLVAILEEFRALLPSAASEEPFLQ